MYVGMIIELENLPLILEAESSIDQISVPIYVCPRT